MYTVYIHIYIYNRSKTSVFNPIIYYFICEVCISKVVTNIFKKLNVKNFGRYSLLSLISELNRVIIKDTNILQEQLLIFTKNAFRLQHFFKTLVKC